MDIARVARRAPQSVSCAASIAAEGGGTAPCMVDQAGMPDRQAAIAVRVVALYHALGETPVGQTRKISLIEVVVIVLIAVVVLSTVDGLLPSPKASPLAYRSVCAANLVGIGKALAMYANSYHGSFPLVTSARFRDSGSPQNGLHSRSDEGTILMFDRGQDITPETPGGLHRWQGVVDQACPVQPSHPHVRLANKDSSATHFPAARCSCWSRGTTR